MRAVTAAMAGLFISACSPSAPPEDAAIASAKIAVSSLLKDPDSAKYDGVAVQPTGAVCGRVNGKNALGAYAGAKVFVYDTGKSTPYLENDDGCALSHGGFCVAPSIYDAYDKYCLGRTDAEIAKQKADFFKSLRAKGVDTSK